MWVAKILRNVSFPNWAFIVEEVIMPEHRLKRTTTASSRHKLRNSTIFSININQTVRTRKRRLAYPVAKCLNIFMQTNTVHIFPVMKHRFLQVSGFNILYSRNIEIHNNDYCRWSSIVLEESFSIHLENI